MATITNTSWITQTDLMKAVGPDMRIQAVAAVLMQYNEVLQDMSFAAANGIAFHQATQAATLPAVTRGRANQAVAASKGTTEQVTDVMEMLQAFCAIDTKLLDRNAPGDAYRAIQDDLHLEAMSQQIATDIFYGNTNQDPEAMLGLAARYGLTTNSKYGGDQIINATGSGAGAQTSIWFVDWAPDAVTGIYPPGTQAGFQFEDWGKQLLGNETDGFRSSVVSEFTWDMGISVVHPKHCVRIANIEVSDVLAGTAVGLPELMIEAEERMPPTPKGRRMIYMNRLVRTALRKEARKEANVTVNLGWDTYMGRRLLMFGDIPIRRCDAILNTETVVS